MSRTPADLEIDMIFAVELLKRAKKLPAFVDLPDWGRRVVADGTGFSVVSIPQTEPAAVAPVAASPEVTHAVTTVNDAGEIGLLIEQLVAGNMDGVQQVLSRAGVKLVPIADGEELADDILADDHGSEPTS